MSSAVSRSASTARSDAAAGLLISWARPAASVPRATSDSRWRAAASMLRTVWKTPTIRCLPNGNHVADQAPEVVGRHAEHAPVRRGAVPWRDSRRCRHRPRRGSRPPTDPGCSMVASTIVLADRCARTSSIRPSSRIHTGRPARPRRNSSSPSSNGNSSPPRPAARAAARRSGRAVRNTARRSSTSITSSPGSGARG